MSLDIFLRELLSSNAVAPSNVEIVQDNAKPSTNGSTDSTSSGAGQALHCPLPICRWSSDDSTLMQGRRPSPKEGRQSPKEGRQSPKEGRQGARGRPSRWSLSRQASDSCLVAPRRRGSCGHNYQTLLPVEVEASKLVNQRLPLSPKREVDLSNAISQVPQDEQKEQEKCELDSLISFYSSNVVGIPQKSATPRKSGLPVPVLRRTSSSPPCSVPPQLPVRMPNLQKIKRR